MPLTLRKPTREHILPLIEKIEHRLQGWQGRLLSRADRLVLVNSVLSLVPTYFMTCFLLPKWAINRIDKIRRRFLWGRLNGESNGISLLNWNTVCLPREWGGMGTPDLIIRNISLILRWWWQLYIEANGLWKSVVMVLKGRGDITHGPKLWIKGGSFFWGNLQKLKKLFHLCCSWNIGDGRSISFWYDNWCETSLLEDIQAYNVHLRQNVSLREALPIWRVLRH